MQGTNPIRAQEKGDGTSLWVEEVFYTLQGEGPFSGEPAVFVRLAGCNLACHYCDTEFESSNWKPEITELLAAIEAACPRHCKLVVVTGGEPFRQNIRPLVDKLLANQYRVQLETNGTLWIDLPESEALHIVCSPKTGSLHPSLEARIGSYKYVVAAGESDPEDGLPILSTQKAGVSMRLARPAGSAPVFLVPMDVLDHEARQQNLQEAVALALKFGYRLTLQLHKQVGLP
jgi:organic radical activating enzyme